jgi:HNH endonuclease
VARALGGLPELTAALESGALAFSAVRELTRVVTPATEGEWVAAAMGKNLRQIEELVAHRHAGDNPDDPPDPQPRPQMVRFELTPESFALLRQARTVLDDEHGTNLSEDALVAALCNAVLDGGSAAETTGRAKFQIAVTVCERCGKGWQEGGGVQVPIGQDAIDRALCDAQHIGSLDGDAPERAYQDIPPAIARFVWRRDGGRCRVPGCRSARGLELHHLVHRSDGGSHDASNITLACARCHASHHAGRLTITGPADRLHVRRPAHAIPTARAPLGAPSAQSDARPFPRTECGTGVPTDPVAPTDLARPDARPLRRAEPGTGTQPNVHVGARASSSRPIATPDRLDAAVLRAQTKEALIGMGWKPAIAGPAAAAAWSALGARATIEQLVFEALRHCPRPILPS